MSGTASIIDAVMNIPLTRRKALHLFSAGAASALLPSAQASPKGPIIRTILKDMQPEELAGGATLFHEHMSFTGDFWARLMVNMRAQFAARNPNAAPAPTPPPQTGTYFMQDLDLMVEEMRAAAQNGVACIVDGGHEDMGRSLAFLTQLSMRSGMPIVAGGGYYTQPFYPPEIAAMSEDQIAEELIRKAKTQPLGAYGEIGSSDEITPDERKVFRAVSKAHLKTNLPIFTHTAFGRAASEQLDIFESMHVNPRNVVIGHLGGILDPKAEIHKAIAKRGAYVGFDRLGGGTDARQVPIIQNMLDAGYAGRVLLSSDFSSARLLKHNGGPGYAVTLTVFVPMLKKAGVDEKTIHEIVVDNPRRFLTFAPRHKHVSVSVSA